MSSQKLDVVPRFAMGRLLITPGAVDVLQEAEELPSTFLRRHVSGDWGNLSQDDRKMNDEALFNCSRIFSSYETSRKEVIWIITEADRSVTTILLPNEY